MLNIQGVSEGLETIRKVKNNSLRKKVELIDEVAEATAACNELKRTLREHGHSNETIRKFLKEQLNSLIKSDEYSPSRKYYPSFLMSKCPRGTLTTIETLVRSDQYTFDGVEFEHNIGSGEIHRETYRLVREYNCRIENYNNNQRFVGETEKKDVIDYGVKLKHFKLPVVDNTLYLGVELEVGRKPSTPKTICKDVMNDLNPNWTEGKMDIVDFAFLKGDSSIPSYSRGFEIVSAPATLAYHQKAWRKFFDNSAKHLRSFTLHTCGMHVHVSKAGFANDVHKGKFLYFYNCEQNRRFMEDIASRKEDRYAYYKANTKINCFVKANTDPEKFRAVNTRNTHTIEVRIFKGNTKEEGFMKNIEFVHASVAFTRQAGLGIHNLTKEAFITWLGENTGTYPHLCRWLAARNSLTVKTVKLSEAINPKHTGKQHLAIDYLSDVA